MATPAVTEQSIGAVEQSADMPNIEMEQRMAASAAAADPTATQVQQTEVEKPYVAPIEDDEKPFDFGAFAAHSKKAAEIAESAEKPAAVAAAPAVATEVAAAAPAVSAVPPAKPVDPRDMSDVEEEYKPLLKQMSNDAFAKIKPLIVEQKKLREQLAAKDTAIAEAKKGGLPENYYEHEMGYVLSPEFNQRSQSVRLADSVLEHWRAQLNAVKSGADTYTPLVTDANGNISIGQPTKVDRGTDTQLSEIHAWALQQSMNEKASLNALSVSHREKHGQVKGWVNDFQTRAFPIFDKDPELGAAAKDTMRTFPAALQANPLAPILARAFVSLARLSQMQAAAGKLPAAGKAAAPGKVVQPSAAQIAGGAASSGGADKDANLFEQFERAKKGLL